MRAIGLMMVIFAFCWSVSAAPPGGKDGTGPYVNPQATELIAPPRVIPANQNQQGNPSQGQFPQGQFPAGQGPGNQNIPPPAQNTPDLPSSAAQGPDLEGPRPAEQDAAQEAANIRESLDETRPGGTGLDLDDLGAADAREHGAGIDPDSLGLLPRDTEVDAAAEALRGITEQLGSNRDQQSDQTRSYGAGITTDPQALLDGAGSGLAGDGVKTDITHNPDGSTTTTTTRRGENGEIIQQDTVTQDREGNVVDAVNQDVTDDGTTITHRARRTADGDYVHSLSTLRRDGTGSAGPTPWRSPDWVANVDPDSPYGKGGGQVIGPGQEAKKPKAVEARAGTGPGARPADGEIVGATPRLDVDVDLVGQPGPDGPAGGGGPGYQGYNPDDFVDPPRPVNP